MHKYPFVKQINSNDCAISCLQMIIKYYKGYINLNELRSLTRTGPNGTTAYNLIEGARLIGFDAKGYNCSLENFSKYNIKTPFIAHVVINKKYQHFVVVYAIDFKKKVIIVADPATKILKISFDEFENIFDNVIIILYPIKKIPLNYDYSLWQFISNIIKIMKKEFIAAIVLSIFLNFIAIFYTFSSKYFIDGISINGTKNYLTFIFDIFLIIGFLKLFVNFFRSKVLIFVSQKIDLIVTRDVYAKLINLPYQYYKNYNTGDLLSRIYDLNNIKDIISKILLIFIDLLNLIISFIILYFINDKLFAISFIFIILMILYTVLFNLFIEKNINEVKINNADYNSFLVESLNGLESIKNMHTEDLFYNHLKKKYINLLKNNFKLKNKYLMFLSLKELVNIFAFLTIMYIGSVLVIDNHLTIGLLISFNTLLTYIFQPVNNISDIIINIKDFKLSLRRILEIKGSQSKLTFINKKIIGNITIKNLIFSYDQFNDLFKNINLEIKAGENILLLGKSGSGKSTLFKIMMGYYKVKRDMLLIDNDDINDYDLECIRNRISYVSQNETLFTDTLYNNIDMYKNIDKEIILRAIKCACVDEIVKGNNLEYDMLIEEGGFNLSGGEVARIILARALTKNFDILLIDEGLNQIDVDTERRILKNIFTIYKNKTIMIISHRNDNMELFDKVISLNDKGVNVLKRNE